MNKNILKILSVGIVIQILIAVFIGVFFEFIPVSYGQTSTSTVSAVTLTISGVGVSAPQDMSGRYGALKYKATVFWTTNKDSDSHVLCSQYFLGGLFGSECSAGTDALVGGSGASFQHSVEITELNPGTTYYYYVLSKDVSGVPVKSDNGGKYYSFTTPSAPDTSLPSSYPGTVTTGRVGGSGQTTPAPGSTGTTPPAPAALNITIGGTTPILTDTSGSFVLTLYKYAMGLVGFAALGAIIWAGILRLTSAGNPSAITKSKEYIWGAVSGIALLAGAALIFNTINPRIAQIGVAEKFLSEDVKQIKLTTTDLWSSLLNISSSTKPLSDQQVGDLIRSNVDPCVVGSLTALSYYGIDTAAAASSSIQAGIAKKEFDVKDTSALNNYIKSLTKVTATSGPYANTDTYRDGNLNYYTNKGTFWHVVPNCEY